MIISERKRVIFLKKIDMIKNYYATMLGYYSVSEIPVQFFLSLSKFIQREKILKEEVLSVTMTRKVKEVLEKDCKVKSAQLSRYIAKAVELNAMIKMGYRGVYKLHNFMIPESEWKNIKSIKCDFSFSTRKCYVKITKIKESEKK